jgi:hypothetical protein
MGIFFEREPDLILEPVSDHVGQARLKTYIR